MGRNKRWSAVLLALALGWTLLVPAAAAGQGTAQATLKYGEADSLQYALIEGTNITASGVVGSQLATEESLYGIGSVSKLYTATAMMQLVEQGKVELDKPVARYLPEFIMADTRYKDITVRMLLNHSAGFYGNSSQNAFLFDDPDQSAAAGLLETMKTQTLKADPGTFSVYCNDGFTLAELVIERVSGLSFTDYVHQYILQPLGNTNSGTPQDGYDADRFAEVYYGEHTLPVENVGTIGTSGMYANAQDLARFGSSFYTKSLLSQESINAMMAPEYARGLWQEEPYPAVSYGLGFDNVELLPFSANNIQAVCKGGDTLSYHASLVILPKYHMAAAVVSSNGASTYNQLLACKLLVDALAQRGVVLNQNINLPTTEPAEIPPEERDKAGYYAGTGMGAYINISRDGVLTSDMLPGMTFQYCADGSYRDSSDTVQIKLVTESNGETYAYQQTFVTLPGLTVSANGLYFAQRLSTQETQEDTWAVWEKQAQTDYLVVSEKPSSSVYLYHPTNTLPVTRNDAGYFFDMLVQSETQLMPSSIIPGMSSRDYQPITLKQEQGKTYMIVADCHFISAADVQDIFMDTFAVCTIQSDGYARWYHVGAAAGRQMNVDVSQGGQFYVYDSSGTVTASSIFGQQDAVLPEGGRVVFIGEPAQKFLITING